MIKATFIDEISHDIPHQNWGHQEWNMDFKHMREMGINTVVMIRCGYGKWLTYPSIVLQRELDAFMPTTDLVKMFLELCEVHEMQFYLGLYDSGKFWESGEYEMEVSLNKAVIDEVWQNYGHYSAFNGWYISHEISRKNSNIAALYASLGHHCKMVSGGLTTMISPYIDGVKNIDQYSSDITKLIGISLKEHRAEWSEIFASLQGKVDIVAFQDGHVSYEELFDFLKLNKELAEKYGMQCWTNVEAFDRDMPIKFLPIKWDKLQFKLKMAKKAGIENAIVFEFSHFMSPQSSYLQAGHLFNRYNEFLRR